MTLNINSCLWVSTMFALWLEMGFFLRWCCLFLLKNLEEQQGILKNETASKEERAHHENIIDQTKKMASQIYAQLAEKAYANQSPYSSPANYQKPHPHPGFSAQPPVSSPSSYQYQNYPPGYFPQQHLPSYPSPNGYMPGPYQGSPQFQGKPPSYGKQPENVSLKNLLKLLSMETGRKH